jgi:hypothetical protein
MELSFVLPIFRNGKEPYDKAYLLSTEKLLPLLSLIYVGDNQRRNSG